MPKGKRVQIYLPADLVERFEQIPRYERSAEVARALREKWGIKPISVATNVAAPPRTTDTPQPNAETQP